MSKTSNHKPGGGIKSRNKVEVGYRAAKPKERIRHAGVAQIGQRQGNHVTKQGATSYGGISPFGAGSGFPSTLGNELVKNVGAGGPGKGRTVMRSGSQCQTGAVDPGNPTSKAKELWPGWEK